MEPKPHTIGRRGLVRIPKSVRARLKLRPGMRVVIEADEASVRIRPADGQGDHRRRRARPAHRFAEDRADLRIARRRLQDPDRKLIPWDEAKADLGLP